LALNAPPILRDGVEVYTDPLPQALVLTAIVISFGMTAVVVMIAVGSYLSAGDDLVNDPDTLADTKNAEPSQRGGGPA